MDALQTRYDSMTQYAQYYDFMHAQEHAWPRSSVHRVNFCPEEYTTPFSNSTLLEMIDRDYDSLKNIFCSTGYEQRNVIPRILLVDLHCYGLFKSFIFEQSRVNQSSNP